MPLNSSKNLHATLSEFKSCIAVSHNSLKIAVFGSSTWHFFYSDTDIIHSNIANIWKITNPRIFFFLILCCVTKPTDTLEALLLFKNPTILCAFGCTPLSLAISLTCSMFCCRVGMDYRRRPGLESCNIGQVTYFWTMFSHHWMIIASIL